MAGDDWLSGIPIPEGEPPTELEGLSDDELRALIAHAAALLRARGDDGWTPLRQRLRERIDEHLAAFPQWLALYGDRLDQLDALAQVGDALLPSWRALDEAMPEAPDPDSLASLQRWRAFFGELEALLDRSAVEEPEETEPADEPESVPAREVDRSPFLASWNSIDRSLRGRVADVVAHFAEHPPIAPARLGLDFGTARSAAVVRRADGAGPEIVLHGSLPVDRAWPTAIAIERTGGGIAFGEAALAEHRASPGTVYLETRVKRLLLDGRQQVAGVFDEALRVDHLAVFTMTWLFTELHRSLRRAGEMAPGDWVDLRLGAPVSGPHSHALPEFWKPVHTRGAVGYPDYLRTLAAAGQVLATVFNGAIPQDWEIFVRSVNALWQERPSAALLQHLARRRDVVVVSDPTAALAAHGPHELGEGLHLVVDSGAAHTSWSLLLLDGSRRILVAEGSAPFGGDDVDALIAATALDELGVHEPTAELAAALCNAVEPLKPHVINDGVPQEVEAGVLDVPGGPAARTVTLRPAAVLEELGPELARVRMALVHSLQEAAHRLAEARLPLEDQWIAPAALSDLRAVHLVGGNSELHPFREMIAEAVAAVGVDAPVLPLPVPEAERSTLDADRWRRAAVALGASRREVQPEPLPVTRDITDAFEFDLPARRGQ